MGGATAGLALGAFPGVELWLATALGILVAAASIAYWLRRAARILAAAASQVSPRFPSAPTGAGDGQARGHDT